MRMQESAEDAFGPNDWPQRWRQVRPSVPAQIRSRVLASVHEELAGRGPRLERSSSPATWSWLAIVAVALVLWIHASWTVSMAEPAPRSTASMASLEAHQAALIRESAP